MSYTALPDGTGPGGAYADGDEWTADLHATRTKTNFADHESRILTLEGLVANVSGVLSIGTNTTPTNPTVLSTVGTVDWWTMINNSTPLNAQGTGYPYRKRFGREFVRNHWIYGDGNGSSFTGNIITGVTMTAADNQNRVAQTAFVSFFLWYSTTGGATKYGYGLVVRATRTQRTLNVGTRVWSGVMTVTAHLTDGSVADQTTTLTAGAGAGAEFNTPITYRASNDREELHVEVVFTTNSGSQPHTCNIYGYI